MQRAVQSWSAAGQRAPAHVFGRVLRARALIRKAMGTRRLLGIDRAPMIGPIHADCASPYAYRAHCARPVMCCRRRRHDTLRVRARTLAWYRCARTARPLPGRAALCAWRPICVLAVASRGSAARTRRASTCRHGSLRAHDRAGAGGSDRSQLLAAFTWPGDLQTLLGYGLTAGTHLCGSKMNGDWAIARNHGQLHCPFARCRHALHSEAPKHSPAQSRGPFREES